MPTEQNIDEQVVEDFGNEWNRFDQSLDSLTEDELQSIFDSYFAVFPWAELPEDARGFDAGCGSGRWARFAAMRPEVGELHCVDPSSAVNVARRNLQDQSNAIVHQAGVDDLPFEDESMDFGYSLGVLHHIPDTAGAMRACVRKLKAGAPFLVYLYYAFDNRPPWFRAIWKASDLGRRVISELPARPKHLVTDAIAATVYWPLARASWVAEQAGKDVEHVPLSAYRDKSFYTMRTDSLDRFGTTLEQRFTAAEIEEMMTSAGLADIRFHDGTPYWCAVGTKR